MNYIWTEKRLGDEKIKELLMDTITQHVIMPMKLQPVVLSQPEQ